MTRFRLIAPLILIIFAFGLTGCGSGDGPSLFSNLTSEIDENDGGASTFGYVVEGTNCVKQLHEGCVPGDGAWLSPSLISASFTYPQNWEVVNSDSKEVMMVPEDDDFTKLYFWKAFMIEDDDYPTIRDHVLDAGTGQLGQYALVWETYSGIWEDQDVTSEWITLTVDPDNVSLNYVLFLLSTPDRFEEDQATLDMIVSSLMSNVSVEEAPAEEAVEEPDDETGADPDTTELEDLASEEDTDSDESPPEEETPAEETPAE